MAAPQTLNSQTHILPPNLGEYDLDDTPLESEVAAPVPVVAAPAAPAHSERDLAEAQDYGFDPEAVKKMAPGDLQRELGGVRRWLVQEQRRRLQADTRLEAVDRGRSIEARQQAAAQQAPTAEPLPAGTIDPNADLDGDFDPRLIALQKQNREMKAKLDAVEGTVQRQVQQTRDDLVDGVFASLNEKYRGLFGAGSLKELIEAKNFKALARRQSIYALARVDFDKHSPRKVAQLLEEATSHLFDAPAAAGDGGGAPAAPQQQAGLYETLGRQAPADQQPAPAGPAKDPVTGRFVSQDAWNAAGLMQPSHRSEQSEKPGRNLATKNLAQRLEDMGRYETSGEVEADDFL